MLHFNYVTGIISIIVISLSAAPSANKTPHYIIGNRHQTAQKLSTSTHLSQPLHQVTVTPIKNLQNELPRNLLEAKYKKK